MTISARMRFLVLKRDGFRCVYCGAAAGDATLHIDHVEAKSKGGEDSPENYVTACARCNGGKGARDLFDKAGAGIPSESVVATTPTLVGKCFVVFGVKNSVELAGIIRAKVTDDLYLVQYFEAFSGEPSTMEIVRLEKMVRRYSRDVGAWEFFEDIQHLDHWLEHVYHEPSESEE